MAQHGMRESGLDQLILLQGSSAPHMENPEWSYDPLRVMFVFIFVLRVEFTIKTRNRDVEDDLTSHAAATVTKKQHSFL